jgi:hypothetical protein
MQDPSDAMEIAEPEENGQGNTADSPVVDDPTPHSDIDSTAASMLLAEVLPGVAVVFGEVPASAGCRGQQGGGSSETLR